MKILQELFHSIHYFLWEVKTVLKEYRRRYVHRDLLKSNRRWIDSHTGESCFIICNGPSLDVEDLEIIQRKGIPSFGSNKIFFLFDKTSWRPTFYAACDDVLYNNYKDFIDSLEGPLFFPLDIYENIESPKGDVNVFSRVRFQFFNNKPKFNPDLLGQFAEGGTITFHLLQLAVAMGFTTIYLTGLDFSYSWGIGVDGKYHEDPSVKDHFSADKTKTDNMPNLYYNLRAFESAKKYADKHQIYIYNATRGGKLEVFERVDIDKTLKEFNCDDSSNYADKAQE